MTNRSANVFSTELNGRSELGEGFMSRMTEVMVTETCVAAGNKRGGSRKLQRVEQPRAIAPDDHSPGLEILHRTTSGIKFNRTIVVRGKLANINKILNKVRETRMLLRVKGPGSRAVQVVVTGSKEPLPTTIEEGEGYRGSDAEDRVPVAEVM
jgi:hypothetical protein